MNQLTIGFSVATMCVLTTTCLAQSNYFDVVAPTVRFSLHSPNASPNVVQPGTGVYWSLVAEVSSDNLGLAGFFCSVVECDGYLPEVQPIGVTVLPEVSVPAGMANFARPLGIANPATPNVPGSGYGGSPFESPLFNDAFGLLEIGGAQNTLGVPLLPSVPMGQGAVPVLGVGQEPGGRVIASGTFYVPSRSELIAQGFVEVPEYPWILELCIFGQEADPSWVDVAYVNQANVITTVGGIGEPTMVVAAEISVGPRLQFAVVCIADFNNTGDVTVQDLFDFLDAYFAYTGGNTTGPNPDINRDGVVTIQDIFDYLSLFFAGC